ncbi:MAG: hypothetical protein QG629_102 [Patescibacteria group bacterium]|nr:hypothetical protein [Candidatus Saccharibacteria bacterium]MDQ5963020.1 hypothetical protein [Patescibacteria group bacterium]
MIATVVFASLILVPIALLVLLRSNGTVLFLSVCLGYMLAQFVSADMVEGLSMFVKLNALVVGDYFQMILLCLPVVLILLFARGSKHNGLGKIIHFLPGIAAGLLLGLLAVGYMPRELQTEIKALEYWRVLSNLQTGIVIAGAFFGLLHLFMDRPKHDHNKKGKHH